MHMVSITIRKVGGKDDMLFKRIEVDAEIHVRDLVKEIEFLTKIPIYFQNIEFRGEQLPEVERPLTNISFGEELVVSHLLLMNWNAYVKMIDEIRRMTTSGVTTGRRDIALKARSQVSPLFSSNFFVVYPDLAIKELEISRTMNFLIHNIKKYLDRSVLAYFEALYPDQKVELKDKSEEFAGIHLGVFVLVDNVACYYAKTLGSIPGPHEEIDFPNRPKVDLMEIYVYVLLKLVGLGSLEVHVLSDVNNSELIFIATKLIEGFRTASGVSAAQLLEKPSTEETEAVVIDPEMRREMRILSSLLCLSDVQRNKGNHGVVNIQPSEIEKKEGICSTHQLRIVDFAVNIGLIDSEPTIFNSTADVPFLKTYVEKWDMQKNIYKAKEEMENYPALKNNKNGNKETFDRYFKRLEIAIGKFSNN